MNKEKKKKLEDAGWAVEDEWLVDKRIPLSGGSEFDALGGWRRWYCYLSRSKVCKKIKTQYNRRIRRVMKKEIL